MEITSVQTIVVEGSYPWIYVRVGTDAGLFGLAEAYPAKGVIGALVEQIEPLLLGRDPLNIEPIDAHLLERTPG